MYDSLCKRPTACQQLEIRRKEFHEIRDRQGYMQEGISRNQGQAGLYAGRNFMKSGTGGVIMQEGIL